MGNYDWHKNTTINQNLAPTTLEECEIIQGHTLVENKHSFQVKATYWSKIWQKWSPLKENNTNKDNAAVLVFSSSHFIFLYFLKKKFLKS